MRIVLIWIEMRGKGEILRDRGRIEGGESGSMRIYAWYEDSPFPFLKEI